MREMYLRIWPLRKRASETDVAPRAHSGKRLWRTGLEMAAARDSAAKI
jgi:hypothetical protein